MGENYFTTTLNGGEISIHDFDISGILASCSNAVRVCEQETSPQDAKTVIKVKGDYIYIQNCKNGKIVNEIAVIPNIVDVSVSKSNNEIKVIFVTFADGGIEKAVLSDDDTFSFEQGISICITKKLLSQSCNGNGGAVYNKLIKHGLKVYENIENDIASIAAKKAADVQKFEKLRKKKAEKKAKREAAMREREISIQAEAYLRAMREFNKQ